MIYITLEKPEKSPNFRFLIDDFQQYSYTVSMRLEKVNDNQIRCILTKEDLEERKIKFSELTFGGEKAKRLFRDVMQEANFLFGFEINDNPLMIEAVPMQSGMVVFVITKVEQPDEFETHINPFSPSVDDDLLSDDTDEEEDDKPPVVVTGSTTVSIPISEESGDILPTIGQALHSLFHEMISRQNPDKVEKSKKTELQNRLFCFSDMSSLLDAAAVLSKYETGDSALYKDPASGKYYILLYAEYLTDEDYRRICTVMSDFCERASSADSMEAHMDEHFELILPTQALQSLGEVGA